MSVLRSVSRKLPHLITDFYPAERRDGDGSGEHPHPGANPDSLLDRNADGVADDHADRTTDSDRDSAAQRDLH
jgi:hypothetical protein